MHVNIYMHVDVQRVLRYFVDILIIQNPSHGRVSLNACSKSTLSSQVVLRCPAGGHVRL